MAVRAGGMVISVWAMWCWSSCGGLTLIPPTGRSRLCLFSESPLHVTMVEESTWEQPGTEKKNGKREGEEEWRVELNRAAVGPQAATPPGALAASVEAGYDEWISSQLRVNRVQACSSSVKESVAERLASLELEGVDGMLKQLVETSTGVRDRAQTSLLSSVTTWHQLLPIGRWARRWGFRDPTRRELARWRRGTGSARWVVERETRWLWPFLATSAVYEARPTSLDTIKLRRLSWGGSRLTFLGIFSLPFLALLPRSKKVSNIKVLYIDADFVVAVDKPNTDVVVLAAPHLADRAKRPTFRRIAKGFSDRRHDAKLHGANRRQARSARLSSDARRDDNHFGIGDLAWAIDTAMDVDDDQMQTFLDKPTDVKSGVSVQDMLDNNLPKEDDDNGQRQSGTADKRGF